MSDNDSGVGVSTRRLGRIQRRARPQDNAAKRDADEVSEYRRVVERKTHREVIAALPTLSVESCVARLPHPIITHLSPDDVCKETMVIVDLLSNENIEIA
jgi:hypothetical protein